MAQFQQSTVVNVPPAKTYDYLADIGKHAEWASHGLQVEKTSDGPIAVGSTFDTVGRLLGSHRARVTITELVPNERIVFESQDDTGHFRHHFALQAADGGTEVTKGVEPLRTSFLFTVLSPLLPLIVPRGLTTDLRKIKARLEA